MKIYVFLTLISSVFSIHLAVKNLGVPEEQYCIVLDANITGTVKYYDDVLNKTQPYDFTIGPNRINHTTTVTGTCMGFYQNKSAESMNIAFYPNDIDPMGSGNVEPWNLTIYFVNKKDNEKSFEIFDYQLKAHFYKKYFNSSESTITYKKADGAELEWGAEETNGFSCSSSGLSFTNDTTVQFKNMKVLAFAMLDKPDFPNNQTYEQCKLDIRTSDLVPIIVGACLAGLVVIVLIAYLIGRARAKRQGYASV